MDVVRMDVVLDIGNHYADQTEAPRELLDGMIMRKRLRVKSKGGFYDY